jgi:2-methylcitrate dehydratase PrpD
MIAERLGEFAAGLQSQELPAGVLDAVKLRVLDTLGAGLAGIELGNHRLLVPLLESRGKARVWGDELMLSAREVALVNSFAVHSTYLEDGSRFTGGHPSSVVIPAVIADAQIMGSSGSDIIAAIVAGYEVFLRLGRAIYPECVNRGFQSTAVLGAVSSAAAVARLRRLSATATTHAIALGANLGVGLKEALKSSATQPIQVARSCEAGMVAALLAQAGAQGATSGIEAGFLRGFGGQGEQSRTVLVGLGSEFRISETYIKRHAGCRGNHAPLDAALGLMAFERVKVQEITRVRVAVDTVTRAAAIEPPRDAAQAQFSIGFSVALALVDGSASIYKYTQAKLADATICAMMNRIEVTVDKALDARYPDERGALVEIELTSGRVLRHSVKNARGEPENPLSRKEVEEKFLSMAMPRLGIQSHALLAAVAALQDMDGERIGLLLRPQQARDGLTSL